MMCMDCGERGIDPRAHHCPPGKCHAIGCGDPRHVADHDWVDCDERHGCVRPAGCHREFRCDLSKEQHPPADSPVLSTPVPVDPPLPGLSREDAAIARERINPTPRWSADSPVAADLKAKPPVAPGLLDELGARLKAQLAAWRTEVRSVDAFAHRLEARIEKAAPPEPAAEPLHGMARCPGLGCAVCRYWARDTAKRDLGCQCHLEAGDSPCRVHGDDGEDASPVAADRPICDNAGLRSVNPGRRRRAPGDLPEVVDHAASRIDDLAAKVTALEKWTQSRQCNACGRDEATHVAADCDAKAFVAAPPAPVAAAVPTCTELTCRYYGQRHATAHEPRDEEAAEAGHAFDDCDYGEAETHCWAETMADGRCGRVRSHPIHAMAKGCRK